MDGLYPGDDLPASRQVFTPSPHTSTGTYTVNGLLGKGGFGEVYDAIYSRYGFERRVALKVLHAAVSGAHDLGARLRDEARILGQLDHSALPTVARLTRVVTQARAEPVWAVEMELVRGLNLDQIMQNGVVPIPVVLQIAREVADCLDYMHFATDRHGRPLRLVHRDLKTGNIMVTSQGQVKILDFGIASAIFEGRESVTLPEVVVGTLGYLAPEVLGEGMKDAPCDIYALGVVLYRMITGIPLGQAGDRESRHDRMITEALNELNAALVLPDGLLDLLYNMLRWNPSDRLSAREVRDDLALLCEESPAPRLADWSSGYIAPLLRSFQTSGTAHVGQVFHETTGETIEVDHARRGSDL